jgi:hypothetical protein
MADIRGLSGSLLAAQAAQLLPQPLRLGERSVALRFGGLAYSGLLGDVVVKGNVEAPAACTSEV